MNNVRKILTERMELESRFLQRTVTVDLYYPESDLPPASLLLINDGQDLPGMPFAPLLQSVEWPADPTLVCAGIHCGPERLMEYGTAGVPDFAGRGAKAGAYQQFIIEELIPELQGHFRTRRFHHYSFAGFSLGGLSALDTVWSHPEIFRTVGVFSGSLWWRTRSLEDNYDEERDRIMHQKIASGNFHPHLRFYFTTGSLDETADRNGNGIIDSIDDTLDLIRRLNEKGYTDRQIRYLNYEDGRHDVPTWARALPAFLQFLIHEI